MIMMKKLDMESSNGLMATSTRDNTTRALELALENILGKTVKSMREAMEKIKEMAMELTYTKTVEFIEVDGYRTINQVSEFTHSLMAEYSKDHT
jgi:hypothetical protein